MRQKLIPLLSLCITICTLCGCSSTPCNTGSFHFGLIGFTTDEADTILVRRYFPGVSFIDVTDSFLLQPGFSSRHDTLEITSVRIPESYLRADYDFQLFFPSIGKTIRLTGITEEKREVKHSIFNNVKVGCENSITGMKADGIPITPAGFNNFYFSR